MSASVSSSVQWPEKDVSLTNVVSPILEADLVRTYDEVHRTIAVEVAGRHATTRIITCADAVDRDVSVGRELQCPRS